MTFLESCASPPCTVLVTFCLGIVGDRIVSVLVGTKVGEEAESSGFSYRFCELSEFESTITPVKRYEVLFTDSDSPEDEEDGLRHAHWLQQMTAMN